MTFTRRGLFATVAALGAAVLAGQSARPDVTMDGLRKIKRASTIAVDGPGRADGKFQVWMHPDAVDGLMASPWCPQHLSNPAGRMQSVRSICNQNDYYPAGGEFAIPFGFHVSVTTRVPRSVGAIVESNRRAYAYGSVS